VCIWEPNTQNVRIAGTSRLGVLIILLFISASIAAGVTATTVAEANVRTVAQRTNGKLVRSGHSFTAWAMRKTGSQLSLEGGFKKKLQGRLAAWACQFICEARLLLSAAGRKFFVRRRKVIMKKVFFTSILFAALLILQPAAWAADGVTIYRSKCAPCHGVEGRGTAMAPDFINNAFIGENSLDEISNVIRNGRQGAAKKYRQYAIGMPRQNMSQDEIVSVVDYLKELSVHGVQAAKNENWYQNQMKIETALEQKLETAESIYFPLKNLIRTDKTLNVIEEKLVNYGGVVAVAFSADNKMLVSGDVNGQVKVWDVETGGNVLNLKGLSEPKTKIGGNGPAVVIAYSPNGKIIAGSTNSNADIIIWDAATGAQLKTLKGNANYYPNYVSSISFTPDGKNLASGYGDHTVILWDVSKGIKLRTLMGHSERVNSVAFSPKGNVIVSGSWDGTIILWDVATGNKIKNLQDTGFFKFVVYSPNGKMLASTDKSKNIVLFDAMTGSQLLTLKDHAQDANSVVFSPNSKVLASGQGIPHVTAPVINLWDIATGTKLMTLKAHADSVNSVAFSPNGNMLASGSRDGTIKLWDVSFVSLTILNIKANNLQFENERDRKLKNLFKPRGEFETTKEYLERIAADKIEEAHIKHEFDERITEERDRAERELNEKRSKLYPITLEIVISKYDADKEGFEADLLGGRVFVNVPRGKAAEINKRKANVTVTGSIKYFDKEKAELIDAFLIDNATEEKFAFGRHTGAVIMAIGQQAPPNLKIVSINLTEPSDNGVLDAGESGKLALIIKNEGNGPAFGVSLAFDTGRVMKGLRLNEKVYIGQISPGEEKRVEADISALEDVQSVELTLKVTLVETSGFDSQPIVISFKTKELIPPLLQIAKLDVEDADGRRVITKGKEAKVTLTVQNAGDGTSRGVVIVAEPGDPNIKMFGDSTVKIGDLPPGASKKAVFSVAVTTRYSGPRELPLRFAINEERDRFSVQPEIKLALNEESPELRVVKVEARETPTPRIENTENIDSPPVLSDEQKIMGDKDIAVVIGIERYRKLPRAEYAYNDAKIVKTYLKSLGFAERNIKFLSDEEATLSGINSSIGTWLPNRIKKESRVFIYYSGHGSPDPVSGEAYLMPHDGDPNYLRDTGYSLKKLYESLGKLDAAEIAVVMDACFSGSGGRSVLAKGARPAVVVIEDPVLASKNIAVLSSTQGTQISTSFAEKEHGLFTYYFLKAIKDGKKDLAEIYDYIRPLVEDDAREQNVEQSPSLKPGPELVRDRFGLKR